MMLFRNNNNTRNNATRIKPSCSWEDVESAIYPIENDNKGTCTKLDIFKELKEQGNVPINVLFALASIIGIHCYHVTPLLASTDASSCCIDDMYDNFFNELALFFVQGQQQHNLDTANNYDDDDDNDSGTSTTSSSCSGNKSDKSYCSTDDTISINKLVCIELLMNEFLPPLSHSTNTVIREDIELVEDTLNYVCGCNDTYGYIKPVHCELDFFVSLRTKCLYLQNEQRRNCIIEKDNLVKNLEKKKQTIQKVVQSSDRTVNVLANTAKFVETGLPIVNDGIDVTGQVIKTISPPAKQKNSSKCPIKCVKRKKRNKIETKKKVTDNLIKESDAIVASVYANKAKHISERVRVNTKTVVFGIRDISTSGITNIVSKFEKYQLGKQLIPDEDSRHVLRSVGKVGLASIGALAIVNDAIIESSCQIGQKSIDVTADVVQHTTSNETYGQIIKDVGNTTGNIIRTASHVTIIQSPGKNFSKAIVKNTSKQMINKNKTGSDGYCSNVDDDDDQLDKQQIEDDDDDKQQVLDGTAIK